jgi:hypothetical protein
MDLASIRNFFRLVNYLPRKIKKPQKIKEPEQQGKTTTPEDDKGQNLDTYA